MKKFQQQVEFMTPDRRHRRRMVIKAEPQENGPANAILTDTDISRRIRSATDGQRQHVQGIAVPTTSMPPKGI